MSDSIDETTFFSRLFEVLPENPCTIITLAARLTPPHSAPKLFDAYLEDRKAQGVVQAGGLFDWANFKVECSRLRKCFPKKRRGHHGLFLALIENELELEYSTWPSEKKVPDAASGRPHRREKLFYFNIHYRQAGRPLVVVELKPGWTTELGAAQTEEPGGSDKPQATKPPMPGEQVARSTPGEMPPGGSAASGQEPQTAVEVTEGPTPDAAGVGLVVEKAPASAGAEAGPDAAPPEVREIRASRVEVGTVSVEVLQVAQAEIAGAQIASSGAARVVLQFVFRAAIVWMGLAVVLVSTGLMSVSCERDVWAKLQATSDAARRSLVGLGNVAFSVEAFASPASSSTTTLAISGLGRPPSAAWKEEVREVLHTHCWLPVLVLPGIWEAEAFPAPQRAQYSSRMSCAPRGRSGMCRWLVDVSPSSSDGRTLQAVLQTPDASWKRNRHECLKALKVVPPAETASQRAMFSEHIALLEDELRLDYAIGITCAVRLLSILLLVAVCYFTTLRGKERMVFEVFSLCSAGVVAAAAWASVATLPRSSSASLQEAFHTLRRSVVHGVALVLVGTAIVLATAWWKRRGRKAGRAGQEDDSSDESTVSTGAKGAG